MTDKASDESLLHKLDAAAEKLLSEMNCVTIGVDDNGVVTRPLEANEKVAIFNSVVRYLAVKHKVAPEDEGAGIDEFVKQLHNPASKGGGGRGSR